MTKILLPPIMKCKRIYKLLRKFYIDELFNEYIDNKTPFNHAIIILSSFYNMQVPKIRFRRSFGKDKCLGKCMENGNIEILYPSCYHGDANSWIGVLYHEFGHYYLWAKAEEKALEYELKMLKRR